jgi:hypothetical protein
MRNKYSFLVATSLVLSLLSHASAVVTYTVTDLGTLGGTNSGADGIQRQRPGGR